jgi:hypothetical protein
MAAEGVGSGWRRALPEAIEADEERHLIALARERLWDDYRGVHRATPYAVRPMGDDWLPPVSAWDRERAEAWLAADGTGRLAELRHTVPGVFQVALALDELGFSMRVVSRELREGVVRGRRLGPLVRGALSAYAAWAAEAGALPGAPGAYVEAMVPLVRRMGTRVPPCLALAPLVTPYVLEDVPLWWSPRQNARWFVVMHAVRWMTAVGGPAADGLRAAFSRWVSAHAAEPVSCTFPYATPFPDLWHHVLATGWRVPRSCELHEAMEAAHDAQWDRLGRRAAYAGPERVDGALLPGGAVAGLGAVTPLLSSEALQDESRSMRHCVQLFWRDVAEGRKSVYHLAHEGAHATLALVRGEAPGALAVFDFAGPHNAPPAAGLVDLARAWLAAHGLDLDRLWWGRREAPPVQT